ncbi:eukaryotic translation initiation factor 3 subunit a [Lycorma delicatula]|uniref:eukaryotic translation initiation factor 3 subunit a n=1 Tax=Lycorma delicatula TaxID=130591 RepID=UPI003F515682
MARYGQRPENALKRANEFIEVGKPARALDTLCEVFKNKKWAFNYSESVLEPIMFKYLDLCVELKKSHIAKEGLFQYRNMFQSVNVGSLENVIRGYLKTAEERTESAREQSQQAVVDIDDLDNLATPESILLSAVSGEDAQDRSDRTILTPWVKFLWESYCQCLELLRTNAHVETLYHDIARMAFQFCLKYNRKTEFRKLCDKLRKHLEDISKLTPQATNVSISKPETQQFNLDTRLVQLDSAIQMELWQEAYKATEDIHGLMNISKKSPVPKTMANYYQKLAMVFWKAGYYLFHAAALFKLFQLSKDMKKNITAEELQRMACRVLLATLSIPLPSAHPEFDRFIETDKSPLEKAQRLAVLLTLPQPPTRSSLLRDIVRLNVVGLASSPLQELYHCLEVDFSPLTLCKRVHAVTESLQGDDQYIPPLQDVTLVRLIRQVSQVYQTIKFDRLLELAHFTTPFHLERLLVECVRHNDMQIRIDHGNGCVHFGMDLCESQREDKPEGPTLQSMPSEQVRNQLINMSTVLTRAMQVINPNANKVEREKLMAQMVQHYHETKTREHQRILARHKIIEDRKEYLERLNSVREEEEARRAEEQARQQALAEQRRLELEREERERKRQESEIQQIRDRHLKEKMQQISQTSHGQKVLKKLDEDDLKNMDAEKFAAEEQKELQKERKEMQQKLKSQEKKVDYFERAKRLEEIPSLQEAFKEKQIQNRKFWEQQEADRIEKLVNERKLAVEYRERLARMAQDKEFFLNKLKAERNSAYQEKLKEFQTRLKEEREKRLAKRKAQRKEERRAQWLAEKEREEQQRKCEEEQRKREEEEKQRREEEEEKQAAIKRMAEEFLAARRREEEEEQRYRKQKEMADRQAEMARKREQEAAKSLEDKSRKLEKSPFWSSKDEGGRGSRFEDSDKKDSPGSWRRSNTGDTTKPSAEPWKPTFRSRETDKKTTENNREGSSWSRAGGLSRERGENDMKKDRDDKERDGYDRDSERDRDRDRDVGRGYDRDRFGGRDSRGYGGRDDDRDRRGLRDRDRDNRDRDIDRDRDWYSKRGGSSFDDRGSSRFEREKRDRERGGDRPDLNRSWRAKEMGSDVGDRGPPLRRDRDDRERKLDWKREGPLPPARGTSSADPPPPERPPPVDDPSDDGIWKKVHRR